MFSEVVSSSDWESDEVLNSDQGVGNDGMQTSVGLMNVVGYWFRAMPMCMEYQKSHVHLK